MNKEQQLEVTSEYHGMRLDKFLADHYAQYSRSYIQTWIKKGAVLVNEQQENNKYKLHIGDDIKIVIPEQPVVINAVAEDIALDIVYEDQQLIVINKPAGLVVHPAAGHPAGTLQNALLHHLPDLATLPRAGIVHRLDKQTTGLLVIAKTLPAHKSLVDQLQARTVSREYDAIVCGEVIAGGTVDVDIGRHPVDRKRMAVRETGGKEAITHYRVNERFRVHTHIKVKLETGRTHQIRVHMAYKNLPLLGDPVYGVRLRLPKAASQETVKALRNFKRQALHASTLSLIHPGTEELTSWSAPLPDDFQNMIKVLQVDNKEVD